MKKYISQPKDWAYQRTPPRNLQVFHTPTDEECCHGAANPCPERSSWESNWNASTDLWLCWAHKQFCAKVYLTLNWAHASSICPWFLCSAGFAQPQGYLRLSSTFLFFALLEEPPAEACRSSSYSSFSGLDLFARASCNTTFNFCSPAAMIRSSAVEMDSHLPAQQRGKSFRAYLRADSAP